MSKKLVAGIGINDMYGMYYDKDIYNRWIYIHKSCEVKEDNPLVRLSGFIAWWDLEQERLGLTDQQMKELKVNITIKNPSKVDVKITDLLLINTKTRDFISHKQFKEGTTEFVLRLVHPVTGKRKHYSSYSTYEEYLKMWKVVKYQHTLDLIETINDNKIKIHLPKSFLK